MKIKTTALADAALDWAVANALGYTVEGAAEVYGYIRWKTPDNCILCYEFKPSTIWSQGGPIIERENIDIEHYRLHAEPKRCVARMDYPFRGDGPTALIAAMRCLVGSKFGAEVEVPSELA